MLLSLLLLGLLALYTGVQERILISSLFGGLGFSCFEKCKEFLNAKSDNNSDNNK